MPLGHPQQNAATPAGPSDPPQFDSGLQDLSRYVEQTVPPTVPAAVGETPPLPRPVYRAYDVGVHFNENYVESMYRLAGRDLALALYDNNNQPVRDHRGRLLTTANRWGRADTVDLSASEERWISHLNATTCAQIDRTRIARDLTLGTDTHVLDPQTVYEARLLPLADARGLRRLDYAVGAQARGTGAPTDASHRRGLDGSRRGDRPGTVAVDRTRGRRSAGALRRADDQRLGRREGARGPFAGGTLLIRNSDPRPGMPQADHPANWTDYRLSVYIRSLDDDIVGAGCAGRDAAAISSRWTASSNAGA